MECNREEAVRAKIIANNKLAEKDYAGAKKFALKAQNLYPGLEGLSQMLTVLDVYISSENKISGEVDWYGILGVNPSDDDETIRKQYRKLALLLHPDKNKSVGADGAFKFLSEAWSLLSDKVKRLAYNQRRSFRSGYFHPKPPSASPSTNGVHNFTPKSSAPPPQPVRRNDTFWTICTLCNMHYEYLRMYLNHTLLCPNCRKPFSAKEIRAPPVHVKPSAPSFPRPPQNSSNPTNARGGMPPSSRTGGSSFAAKNAANAVFQKINEKLKRAHEDVFKTEGGPVKKGRLANSTRDLSQVEIRNMLMSKARVDIRKKLNEWAEEDKRKIIEKEKEKGKLKLATDERRKAEKISLPQKVMGILNNQEKKQEKEHLSMNVPDPDFHDFDLDRTESSFGDNQVWAAYDDDDGMPRFYAMIHKVITKKPFKMKISWLNSKSTAEFGQSSSWIGSGFYKTSGEFWVGRHEINKSINSFSHKVNWAKGPRGAILILPKKGQVWALYRNWAEDWNEQTPDEVIHKYDMVEVLDDYTEDRGITVTPLYKVDNFKTVFRTRPSPDNIKRIPKEEMFRFSHQVPNYMLMGHEAQNAPKGRLKVGQEAQKAPKGCLELDPAATPLDLLQVAKDEENTERQ